MKLSNIVFVGSLVFVLYAAVSLSFAASVSNVDNSIYAELLKKYVIRGEVNYAGLKSEENKLDQYLMLLEEVDPASLNRDEQFAFYTNVYNAWTLKLILSGYPEVKSIKDLGSFFESPWKKNIVRISGGVATLDDVEHNILRPRFGDPRVHFAINCAAKSCPPLRSEPYLGAVLDHQLDHSTRSFLNNPKNYRLDGNEFYVSRIFKWFAEDFNDDVLGFYLKYADDELKIRLQAKSSRIKVKYLPYDWSLNGK
jgi:hypothetical protein